MVKVTFLYHSGFVVELERHMLVFDYYKGELPTLPAGKMLLFFASHKHQDHFQLSALRWAAQQEDAVVFLGNDIRLNEAYLTRQGIRADVLKRTNRIRGGQCVEISGAEVRVEALRSTDQGVAFLVQVEGISFYHAGDLNYWYWAQEAKAWNDQMEKDYKAEIDRLSGKHFDFAFVPLDPRLEEGYHLGLDYFLEKAGADVIFPMHMWENYSVIQRYKQTPTGRRFAGNIQDISQADQTFVFFCEKSK